MLEVTSPPGITVPSLPSTTHPTSATVDLSMPIKELHQLFEQVFQAGSRKPPFYEPWGHALTSQHFSVEGLVKHCATVRAWSTLCGGPRTNTAS